MWISPLVHDAILLSFVFILRFELLPQQTQNICITFVQPRPNNVHMLYKCFAFPGSLIVDENDLIAYTSVIYQQRTQNGFILLDYKYLA